MADPSFMPGLLPWLSSKRISLKCWRHRLDPWVGKILERRAWQPTPVYLPRESHGQRRLADYSPWGHKESDTTEATEHIPINLIPSLATNQ